MSIVSKYIAALDAVKSSQLKLKINSITRAYVTEMGSLVTVGGAFGVKDALELAAWIVEVYSDEDTN